MSYLTFKSKYNKFPKIKVTDENSVVLGYKDIINTIFKGMKTDKKVLVLECFPGVRYSELMENLISPLNPNLIIKSDDLALDKDDITKKIYSNLTKDRVFGVISEMEIKDLYIEKKVIEARKAINNAKGLVVIYGFGASHITLGDTLVYFDLARWEIQQRFRSGELTNWKMDNYDLDILRKYKRAYFVEWRIADRIKKSLFEELDYYIDTNGVNNPKMITGKDFLKGLIQSVKTPFRLVPYFDPGIWGGQWMKEVCDLDKSKDNFAWSFDGVPEENSVYMEYGNSYIEMPALNIVFYQPIELLGKNVFDRFGKEFPIRFDFLDTVKGGNLSLQVHPLTPYIKKQFGMKYTQDESYYILHAEKGSSVFLGVKENVDKSEMFKDLRKAKKGNYRFPHEKYINEFPAKTHDHFLIPAGTIHCSGSETMVLEISATPYIFTFKLWDWGRLGLDGIPRPVHLDHGEKVIQWNRTTKWVKDNLVDQSVLLEKNDNFTEERTGLHELEFIETRRHFFTGIVKHKANDSVHVLNLIHGQEAIIKSINNSFEPYIVHYAETFIIPANVGNYTIEPHGPSVGKKIGTIKAYIRN